MTSKAMWEIRLIVEVEDDGQVEALSDAVGRVACPHDDAAPHHACPVPWFVVSSPVEQPDEWRELLNR